MARKEPQQQGTTDMTPKAPFVHPQADPAAQAYLAARQARQANAELPKTNNPVAGGPTPPIPRLDGSPGDGGMTMAQHALSERGGVEAPAPAPGGVGTTAPAQEAPSFVERAAPSAPTAGKLPLLAGDMLTETAQQDPAFQQGQGSMYATSQPELARKHGVMRGGTYISPQQLGQKDNKLSAGTLEGIKALEEANRLTDTQEVPQPSSDLGEAAGRAGNLPGDKSSETLSEEDRKALQKSIQELDEFQYDSVRQSMVKDILNNDEQKKIIEERLKPLDVGDLIMDSYVRQIVPIIPGKFEVTFTTVSGETDLAIKRLVMIEANTFEVGDRYYLDRYSLMAIAAGTWGIMGKPLQPYINDLGAFDDDMFMKKFNAILKYPMHMLASLGVNQMWFDMRVRKLFSAEIVGNG